MPRIDYTRDMVAFMRDLFPVEGQYGPIPVIPPFLERWVYAAFPMPDGLPSARNVLDARTKKQGKSALAAGVASYIATRQKHAEVVIAAADKEQAKDRVLRSVKYAFENGPLGRYARVYKDVIELDNGSLIQAVPMDWRGAAGGNYAAVIFDELHVYTLTQHERIFGELVIPPTQPNGVRWIASYAGYLGESVLLKELWDSGLAGERLDAELPIYRNTDASLLALIDTGPASWRMPWTQGEAGRRYLAEAERSTRPNTYRRLWLNEWVSSESQFVDPAHWNACRDAALRPLQPRDSRRLVLAADASTTGDLTALVGVAYDADRERVEVLYSRVWKPIQGTLRGGKPTVDLEATLGVAVRELWEGGYQILALAADPYQLHAMLLAWEKLGLPVLEFPQGAKRVEADQGLYTAIVSESLAHYGDPELSEHVLNALAVETTRGFRLAKEKSSLKIDAAVALSMAHHTALELGNQPTFRDLEGAGGTLQGFVTRWEGIGGEEKEVAGTGSTHLMRVTPPQFEESESPAGGRRWRI
jgi:hypothetical protein